MSEENTNKHALVICHGLMGNPTHTQYLADAFGLSHPELIILNCAEFPGSLTLDGIDTCGELVVEEIHNLSPNFNRISFLGYSLGGLILRYAIGKLHMEGFFDRVQPVNFISIATPHLGLASFHTIKVAQLYPFRSGRQALMADDEYGMPLLWMLTHPEFPFMQGLKLFKQHLIVANVIGDNTVPYLTASIQMQDPYQGKEVVPMDASNPTIVRPSAELVKWHSSAFKFGRSFLKILVIAPIISLLFLCLSPWAMYQSRQTRLRHEPVKVDAMIQRLQDSGSQVERITPAEAKTKIVDAFNKELPNLKRVDVWLGDWRHTHAYIVVRNPRMHGDGKPVVRYVTEEFLMD